MMTSLRFGLTFAVALVLALPAAAGETEAAAEGRPIVVKIHADWCGSCRKLNPTWDELQTKYGDSVRFVLLDVTGKSDVEQSGIEADKLGIRAIFDRYKGNTGTIAVVNGNTLEVVEVMKGQTDVSKYDPAITRARES